MSTIAPSPQCRHCTVPIDSGDICAFCQSYTPPSPGDALLAGAHCHASQGADDLAAVLAELGDQTPLPAAVDIVTARAHLVAAQRLIDNAATRITAVQAVAR